MRLSVVVWREKPEIWREWKMLRSLLGVETGFNG